MILDTIMGDLACHETAAEILARKGSQIWSIGPDATVFEAIQLMDEVGAGALLVLAGGRLVGMISERDYARKVILKGRSSRDTRVSEIMSTPAITVRVDGQVGECLRLMTEKRVRHLPVMLDNGSIAGVLSIGDLVNAVVSAQAAEMRQLKSYVAGHYPA
jgi:CBS domain-containing protein